MAHDVFISYSHKDKSIADAMCFALEENGIRCWYAPRDIEPGKVWADSIVEAVSQSKVFILVFTDFSNKSSQVKREVDQAVNNSIPILPFRLTETLPQGGLAYYLSTVHWLDSLTQPLEKSISSLVEKTAAILSVDVDDKTELRLFKKYRGKLAYSKPKKLLGFRTDHWYKRLLTIVYFAALVFTALYFFIIYVRYIDVSRVDMLIGVLLIATIAVPYIVLSVLPENFPKLKSSICVLLPVILLGGSFAGMLLTVDNRYIPQTLSDRKETLRAFADSEGNEYSNTAANIIGGGYAVKSGKYIYFRDEARYRYSSLSRLNIETLAIDKLDVDQRVRSLNAVGDLVYYSHDAGGGKGEYRIGRFDTKTYERNRTSYRISNMMFCNNVIVFIDDLDGNIYYMIIDKHKTKTLITEPGSVADKMAINGPWVYYILTENGDLCRARFDGKEKEVVAENVQSYQLSENNIYVREKNSRQVISSDPDGKNPKVIAEEVAGDFLVDDGKLFYRNSGDHDSLYCMDLTTGVVTRLCEDSFDVLAGIDGYVYGFSGSGSLFRVKADGTDYSKIQ